MNVVEGQASGEGSFNVPRDPAMESMDKENVELKAEATNDDAEQK